MAKHTEGPWRSSCMVMDADDWTALNASGPKGSVIDIVQRGQDVIAAVWCGDDCDGEEAANARLIAAAPDLLEALEDAERALTACNFDETSNTMRDIRAAIAKATK